MSEDRQPAPLAGVADLEAAGYARLPEALRAYVTGGAGEMRTVAANRAAFGAYNLVPRLFGEVAGGHTRRALFGEELTHPFIVAPTALHRLAHPEGECETARAVAAQDGLMIVSTQSSMPLDRIAATGVRFWFQLYLQPHPQATRLLISRAGEAGARAIVVTADAPVAGLRYAEQRAGFAPPADIRPVLLDDLPKADPVGIRPDQSPVFDGIMASAPRWSDFAETCAATRLPVLLKGVMTPEDARRALDAGAAGLIVSNHGGRALDGVAATLDALPAIAEAVGGDAVVLMDGGIRSGGDAFTALALGADAVGIGRPVYAGLAAAGEDGVRFLLSTLRHELEVTMALCGTRVLDEIAAACVQEARPARR